MAALDNRHLRSWRASNPTVDHVGWPNYCDVENLSVTECVEQYVCPAYHSEETDNAPDPKKHVWGGFEYDNFGYTLVDAVIEQVTGGSTLSYLVDRFFKPLGMNKTIFCMTKHHNDGLHGCYGAPTATQLFGRNWPLHTGGKLQLARHATQGSGTNPLAIAVNLSIRTTLADVDQQRHRNVSA